MLEGGYLRDSGGDGMKLSFSEGSQVVLMPGARGRLRALGKDGTRVVVDHGTASFEVSRTKQPRWFVEAGPFLVAVKGTLFTVSWDPARERFELRLKHGSVAVSGPGTEGEIALRAGQRLFVNLLTAETLISEEKPEPSVGSTPEAVASAAGQLRVGLRRPLPKMLPCPRARPRARTRVPRRAQELS